MRKGNMIKHKRYMDICLYITDAFDYGHGVRVKVDVWNMAFVESFNTGQKLILNIAKKDKDIKPSSGRLTDFSQWEMLSGPQLVDQCYRYSQWSQC